MEKCPNCKSKRINKLTSYQEIGNKPIYYCMECEKEFNCKGEELEPLE